MELCLPDTHRDSEDISFVWLVAIVTTHNNSGTYCFVNRMHAVPAAKLSNYNTSIYFSSHVISQVMATTCIRTFLSAGNTDMCDVLGQNTARDPVVPCYGWLFIFLSFYSHTIKQGC